MYTQPDNAVTPIEADDASCDESRSVVTKWEDRVKDLEQKVANLFMDNVALTTKLKASREVEMEQKEEIRKLEERLVLSLKEQVSINIIFICQEYMSDMKVHVLLCTYPIYHDIFLK